MSIFSPRAVRVTAGYLLLIAVAIYFLVGLAASKGMGVDAFTPDVGPTSDFSELGFRAFVSAWFIFALVYGFALSGDRRLHWTLSALVFLGSAYLFLLTWRHGLEGNGPVGEAAVIAYVGTIFLTMAVPLVDLALLIGERRRHPTRFIAAS